VLKSVIKEQNIRLKFSYGVTPCGHAIRPDHDRHIRQHGRQVKRFIANVLPVLFK
jgi:hypothetical protein